MTIRPGVDWGGVAAIPPNAVPVSTDAALADALARGDDVLVRGGDLFRNIGASSPGDTALRLPIDTMRVSADGVETVAVAHVVARRGGRSGCWRGQIVCVMNVEHIGRFDVAPRAHPNDGRIDIVEVAASMRLRTRWHAYRRLPTGTHVPHPQIGLRRARAETFDFDRPLRLWVDGVERETVRSLTVSVTPDAAVIYV